ncbi:hypothetical protein [Novipirellula sp.]|uniref:hypothetical protein n=1 Tax=Novipirellula sp. TaxID=2795430 RepID=UPI0035684FEE
MNNELSAIDFVQTAFPPTEGERLADALLKDDLLTDGLVISLDGCSPALLISAFFNGFLQRVYEQDRAKFESAKRIEWKAEFDFQNANIRKWVNKFEPRELSES